MYAMSARIRRRVRPKRLRVSRLKTVQVFPRPSVVFTATCFDMDGDGIFGQEDLRALSKRHFAESWSLGDGHCFFRTLDRFMKHAKLYTGEEVAHFKRTRERLLEEPDVFPEICYLRRITQKFCQKVPIRKYGREQEPSEDAMDYAAESQAHGLLAARQLSGTGARGYADSPDYAAAAVVLGIAICILQTDGKWQVFPDDCLEEGFGDRPIMFAYNQGDIHFNGLDPNLYKWQKRAEQIVSIGENMMLTKPSKEQSCRIASYFFNGRSCSAQIDKDLHYIKRIFGCSLDCAIEMLYIRIPITGSIHQTIEKERLIMMPFSQDMFVKLLTYGNIETRAGFKTAKDLMKYLSEKTAYLSNRDQRSFTIDEIADIYLKGD